jgi:hypothetical protein
MEETIKMGLYSPESYQDCLHRIEKMTHDSRPSGER